MIAYFNIIFWPLNVIFHIALFDSTLGINFYDGLVDTILLDNDALQLAHVPNAPLDLRHLTLVVNADFSAIPMASVGGKHTDVLLVALRLVKHASARPLVVTEITLVA